MKAPVAKAGLPVFSKRVHLPGKDDPLGMVVPAPECGFGHLFTPTVNSGVSRLQLSDVVQDIERLCKHEFDSGGTRRGAKQVNTLTVFQHPRHSLQNRRRQSKNSPSDFHGLSQPFFSPGSRGQIHRMIWQFREYVQGIIVE